MKLEEFEKLLADITPGDWWKDGCYVMAPCNDGKQICVVADTFSTDTGIDDANAAFIAACSEMVPRMIKVLKLVKEHIAWADEFTYASSIIPADLRLAIAELEQP